MARWQSRRGGHGTPARVVLHRLLRRADAIALRRCRDGSALGRSLDCACDGREALAQTDHLADRYWRRLVGRGLFYVVWRSRTRSLSEMNRAMPAPARNCAIIPCFAMPAVGLLCFHTASYICRSVQPAALVTFTTASNGAWRRFPT